MKVVRKITKRLQDIRKDAINTDLPLSHPGLPKNAAHINATKNTVTDPGNNNESITGENDEEPKENSNSNKEESAEAHAFREKQREMIQALDLSK